MCLTQEFPKAVENELVEELLPHFSNIPATPSLKMSILRQFVEHFVLSTIDVDRLAEAMDFIISEQQHALAEELKKTKKTDLLSVIGSDNESFK